jgi:YfiH family protein
MSFIPQKVTIIQSRLLSDFPKVRCGVGTRTGGVSPEPFGLNLSFNVGDDPQRVTTNRERLFESMRIPIDRVAFARQIHSVSVAPVQHPGVYESCDALISNQTGLFLAITVADCLPIFLYDPSSGAFAAVHAGWRGSKERILEKAIDAMSIKYRTDPKNIFAFIGPSAGVCCYEVGDNVASRFEEKYIVHRNNNTLYLDLKLFNKDLMLINGIDECRIEISDYCTICNPDLFHSYRREGNNSGRMMGVIGISD